MLRNSANWYLVANCFEPKRQKKIVFWKKITCTLIYSTPAVGAASCSMQASFAVLLSIQGRRKRKGQGAMAPPDLPRIEKRTEAEKDNLLLLDPPDFWTFRRLWYCYVRGFGVRNCHLSSCFILSRTVKKWHEFFWDSIMHLRYLHAVFPCKIVKVS